MKNAIRIVGLVSLFVPIVAMAQFQVTIDENGNGSYTTNSFTTPFSGVLTLDPSSGSTDPALQALVYALPFNFGSPESWGDVVMMEPPNYTDKSDVIRFWGYNQIIFYSESGDADLADVSGLPTNSMENVVSLHESGEEGGYQYSDYHPLTEQPGYVWGGPPLDYTFISEIPEPSTLALAGLGLAGLALMAYHRRSK